MILFVSTHRLEHGKGPQFYTNCDFSFSLEINLFPSFWVTCSQLFQIHMTSIQTIHANIGCHEYVVSEHQRVAKPRGERKRLYRNWLLYKGTGCFPKEVAALHNQRLPLVIEQAAGSHPEITSNRTQCVSIGYVWVHIFRTIISANIYSYNIIKKI